MTQIWVNIPGKFLLFLPQKRCRTAFLGKFDDVSSICSGFRLFWVCYFRRNQVYASWKFDKGSISVNRISHFQVHFVWQVWGSQLSPVFKFIRLKAFGGWKLARGTTKLHARILRGKGVQKKKANIFTVGSSTSATFVLPVYNWDDLAA